MSKTPNKTLIGIFTVSGLAFFVGFMALFLWDKLFIKEDSLVVVYFDESIKGLSIGSPVVLKGVEVGNVAKIKLEANTDDLSFKIPVYVHFNVDETMYLVGDSAEKVGSGHFAPRLVEKGLRARLASQNILTGQLMIELEMLPDTKANYKGNGKNIEIPTVLSQLGAFSKGLQDLPVRESIERFNSLLEQTNTLMSEVNKTVKSTSGEASSTLYNLNKTINDIGDAAKSLRNFADYIERHPEALIKGKGGSY